MSRFTLRKLLPVAVFAALAIPVAVVSLPALADDSGPSGDKPPKEDRIVGGGTVEESDLKPWIVALHNEGDFRCTSSQISAEWILTAAHCVTTDGQYTARIGSLTRSSGGTVVDVSEIKIHPDYQQGNLYDIAVIKLAEPFENDYAKVAWDDEHLKVGQASTIYGWGSEKADWSGPLPENLKYSNGTTTETYCEMPEDVCVIGDGAVAGGDSGGPVLVKSPATGEILLAGACEAGHNPADYKWGGYASTVFHSKWLKETTGL